MNLCNQKPNISILDYLEEVNHFYAPTRIDFVHKNDKPLLNSLK